MSLNDFLIEKKLGDGAFSTVYAVKRISDGERYALKKVKMGKLTEKEKANAVNEIRILASIQHPNVIGYKEAFFEQKDGSLCIIMELADGGDLLQAIEKRKKTQVKFTEEEVWHFFVQIARGLKALHDLKIVHRDIKCANLFLTQDGVVKLGDLNVSKVAKMGLLSTQTGTPYYASPEVWKDRPYDHRSDIWSLGCVLYEMITLLPPFRASSMAGLAKKVTQGQYEKVPAKFSVDLAQMVRSLLQVEPRNRPTIDKVLATPGLIRHLTQKLSDVDSQGQLESQANLLKTIRCPRDLKQISSKLPKPQYECETPVRKELGSEITPDKKSVSSELREMRLMRLAKARTDKKPLPKMMLPTIEEDAEPTTALGVDEEMEHMSQERSNAKKAHRAPVYESGAKPKYVNHRGLVKKLVRRLESDDAELQDLRSNRQSQEQGQAAKELLKRLNQIKPNSRGNQSDSTEVTTSTRVSSGKAKSLGRANVPKNIPSDKYGAKTPKVVSSVIKPRNLQQAQKRQPHHHASIDLASCDRASQALQLPGVQRLRSDPRIVVVSSDQVPAVNLNARNYSRFANGNKRNESVGMTRAMGGLGSANRYEGVQEAIAVARALSNEGYQRNLRGPCPNDYRSDRRHQEVSRSVQSLPGLPGGAQLAGYNSDRRQQVVATEHKYIDNQSRRYAPVCGNYVDRQPNSQLGQIRYGQRAVPLAYF